MNNVWRRKWQLVILSMAISSVLMASPLPANMPNPAVTPGFTNPAVTQQNVQKTVCVSGWTATIRPPASYTTRLKIRQLANGPYQSSLPPTSFEEDHLISLELGGNPTDERNLWPEHWNPPYGAHQKDQVENWLHKQVCTGKLSLHVAQVEIATNWIAVYDAMQGGMK